MNRRNLFEILLKTAGGAAIASVLAAGDSQAAQVTEVFEQALPPVSLAGWVVTVLEVVYAPGESSEPHRHPGFVLGLVLEGEIRFQLKGHAETTYHACQMFYEPPGSLHLVSANGSATQRARFLAMIFAKKGSPESVPA